MKTFLHLLKYNMIFNKVRMSFLTILALFILSICYYFFENTKELGEALIQYSFYVMFIIFTGKMNAKNSMMFDIKQIMSFPLTNKEIVLLRSLTDTVQMLPIGLVLLHGVSLAYPTYHISLMAISLYLLITLANVISFNKRIDFSRMQHSKASFRNSILFLHKYLEMGFQMTVAVICIGAVFVLTEKNVFMQEYGILILIITALIVTGNNTLKMLVDETRSYFIFKRDTKRIGWKLLFVLGPLLMFHNAYKNEDLLKEIFGQDHKQGSRIVKTLKNKIRFVEGMSKKKSLLLIVQGDDQKLSEYLSSGEKIPWETEIMGNYPAHLATVTGNKKILELMFKIKPEVVNTPGKFTKKTPLYSAINHCNLEIMSFLVENGATINYQDIKGNTPMIYAAKKGCLGGVFLLQQLGAKADLKNLEGLDVTDYLRKSSGMAYFFKETIEKNEFEAKLKTKRELASKKNKIQN